MSPPPVGSRLPGFFRLSPAERLDLVARSAFLPESDRVAWLDGGLPLARADLMVENVIGTFALPQGVAVNMRVNDRDVLVPMVVEEPSVVAAVSNVARMARSTEGFRSHADPSLMIGQVQIPDVADPLACLEALERSRSDLETFARALLPELQGHGGGFRAFSLRRLRYDESGERPEDMVVVQFEVDCVDAMGANMVNTMAEALAGEVEAVTGLRVGLRILSNLADRRIARSCVRILREDLALPGMDGDEVAHRIAGAWRFAWCDPYRAATHNKGIFNGIDAMAIATGNDWRSIEAGAHAYAARSGTYRPLSTWKADPMGDLVGSLEMPLAVGIVGGSTRVHPAVGANLRMLGVKTARELAEIMAAVGLAQNLAALRALVTTGIQSGHMRLHARAGGHRER